MSCSLCRMPFVPGKQATSPLPQHYPPTGILSPSLYNYFTGATGLGRPEVQTIKSNFDYVSGNMFCGFNGFIVFCVVWETELGTAAMMHSGCTKLLLHRMEADTETYERFVKLAEVTEILSRPLGGKDAGRYRDVHYEEAGEKIDLRPFWVEGSGCGENAFDWKGLSESPYSFLINRPDVFPRFFFAVSSSRLEGLDRPSPDRTDRLTNQPLELIAYLLPFLPVKDYLNLISTCRFLRLHSLTMFQSHARSLVLQLPWAILIPAEVDEMSTELIEKMPNAETTPHNADWLLYLSHIHRTKSMRMRRWIWSLCDEVHRVYEAKKVTSPVLDPTTPQYEMAHLGLDMAYEMAQMSDPNVKKRKKPKNFGKDELADMISKLSSSLRHVDMSGFTM